MKFSNVSAFRLITAALTCFFVVGCSDPQKEATRALEAKGYENTLRDLLVAAGSGDTGSLDLFVASGVGIDETDESGNTALIKAAGAGYSETVEKILGLGADPRHTNTLGRNALLVAAGKGYTDVARMLMGRGADTKSTDKEGWSALSLAAYNGHADTVSLLSAQASASELDDALLVASFSGDAKVIRTLLSQGANINARSPESRTPLMIASENGKLDAVRVLLQNQANPYSVDDANQTAANLADASGFMDVSALIMTPDNWGTSEEGEKVAAEMAEAREALASESAVEVALAPEQNPVDDFPVAPIGKEVRKEAEDKPIVALNGATLNSRVAKTAPVETMVLAAYHEEPLPIVVKGVDGGRAQVQRLDQRSIQPMSVSQGGMIPGTEYQVKEVTQKYVSSKEGKGRMVDVSRVKIENTRNGSTHLLVKDVSGQTSDSYAILAAPGSDYRYVVKAGDVFRTSQPGYGARDYQVLDIRSNGVVIKDLDTEDVVTVARDGVLQP